MSQKPDESGFVCEGMQKYERHEIVYAVQVTAETFTNPHPNPEHVPGVVYFPKMKRVLIRGTTIDGRVGDWIIRQPNGNLGICRDDYFREVYTQATESHR